MESIGREALDLSKEVYGPGQGAIPPGFERIAIYDQSYNSGYYAEAWSNGSQVLIVSRGTENISGHVNI